MKLSVRSLIFVLLAAAAISPSGAQTKRKPVSKSQQIHRVPAHPNVSGEPAYITSPSLQQAPPEVQPQMQMNLKPQRKVRVVPAPPPPGPVAPAIPRKETTTY